MIKSCQVCGKSYKGKITTRFCGYDCRTIFDKKNRKEKISEEIKCIECGSSFVRKNANEKYCSIRCRRKHNKKAINKTAKCLICGIEFDLRTEFPTKKTCSNKCRNLLISTNSANKKEIEKRKCLECDEYFEVKVGDNKRKYCSRKCSPRSKILKLNKSKLLCKCCGKEYLVWNYRKNVSNYCSKECLNLMTFGYNESKLEKEIFEKIISSFDIKKSSIKIGTNLFYPDILYKNKIVEFYGDYWHCNPNIDRFNNSFITRKGITSEEQRSMDLERIKKIKDGGYDVLIVWESDYLSDKDICIDKIKSFLLEN